MQLVYHPRCDGVHSNHPFFSGERVGVQLKYQRTTYDMLGLACRSSESRTRVPKQQRVHPCRASRKAREDVFARCSKGTREPVIG